MTTINLLGDLRTKDQRLADLLIALETADLPRERREACRQLVLDARRPTVTWQSPRPHLHVIDGQQLDSDLLGLTAAHLAFMSQGRRLVRAADLAAPGARRPENAVRNALRVAETFLWSFNAHAAGAVKRVRVVDGFVTYDPDGRVDVVAS